MGGFFPTRYPRDRSPESRCKSAPFSIDTFGLENRYGRFRPSRVRIPPPPLSRPYWRANPREIPAGFGGRVPPARLDCVSNPALRRDLGCRAALSARLSPSQTDRTGPAAPAALMRITLGDRARVSAAACDRSDRQPGRGDDSSLLIDAIAMSAKAVVSPNMPACPRRRRRSALHRSPRCGKRHTTCSGRHFSTAGRRAACGPRTRAALPPGRAPRRLYRRSAVRIRTTPPVAMYSSFSVRRAEAERSYGERAV